MPSLTLESSSPPLTSSLSRTEPCKEMSYIHSNSVQHHPIPVCAWYLKPNGIYSHCFPFFPPSLLFSPLPPSLPTSLPPSLPLSLPPSPPYLPPSLTSLPPSLLSPLPIQCTRPTSKHEAVPTGCVPWSSNCLASFAHVGYNEYCMIYWTVDMCHSECQWLFGTACHVLLPYVKFFLFFRGVGIIFALSFTYICLLRWVPWIIARTSIYKVLIASFPGYLFFSMAAR